MRVALDAGVVGSNIIHGGRVQDVGTGGMCSVFAARTMTTLAADVPLRSQLVMDVIVHRMAPIAGRPRRALHVVGKIVGRPPIRSGVRDMVLQPLLVADISLHRQRIVIVADLREVPLLPFAAIEEGHLNDGEPESIVRLQIWNDSVRIEPGIADNVRHRRFLPTLVDVCMAFLAGFGANIEGRARSAQLKHVFLLGGERKLRM